METTMNEAKTGLDLVIIASENDLPRLPNTLRFIPKVDNIYILQNQKSDNGEESLELVHKGGTIHHYLWKWVDTDFHFANARNKVVSLSDNEWIFWMDCDDALHPSDCEWIDNSIATFPDDVGAVMFGCSGLAHFEGIPLSELADIPGISVENWGYWSSPTVRLIRRKIAKWTGRVHEQVLDSVQEAGYRLMISDIMVKHRGYVTSIDTYIGKMQRNIKLLELELQQSTKHDGIYMDYLHSSTECLKGLVALRDSKNKSDSA
jgi:hypothetical protein